ncbi:hypothetical protein QQ045_007577 [Rhodiola kirilowii]
MSPPTAHHLQSHNHHPQRQPKPPTKTSVTGGRVEEEEGEEADEVWTGVGRGGSGEELRTGGGGSGGESELLQDLGRRESLFSGGIGQLQGNKTKQTVASTINEVRKSDSKTSSACQSLNP